mgnify:CR=1 FL=1
MYIIFLSCKINWLVNSERILILAKTGHKILESLLKDNSSLFMSSLMIDILVFCIAILSENS